MNEQVADKPRNRWWWIVAVFAVLIPVLIWGFQTAISMEEGPADVSAPAS